MFKKSLRGFIDPISLIGVSLFLISLIVGVNVVVNHGSFDIRNWAAACVHDTDCPSGYTCAESYTCEKSGGSSNNNSNSSSTKKNGSSCVHDSDCNSGYCAEDYKCESKSGSNSKNSSTSTTPVYNYKCNSGYYACNVGCCGVGGTPTEGKRYYGDSSNVWNASTPYNKLTDSQKKNYDQAMKDNGLKAANSAETDNSNIKTISKMNQLSAQEIANFYADPTITDAQLAKIYCTGKTDPNCTNNFKRLDFISTLSSESKTVATTQYNTNKEQYQNQTDNTATVTRGNEIANEDTASLFTNPDVTDSQLAGVYCVGKATDCPQTFQRADFISSLTDSEKLKAQGIYEENLTNKLMKTNADYDTKIVLMQIVTRFQNTSISDTTLAQDYCNNFGAWGYSSQQDCTTKFKRSDYLSIASQLQRNLASSPASAESTTTKFNNNATAVIKTANNFCFDILNTDCVNGCIPDTSGGKCKTIPSITPATSKTINTNPVDCAKATDGYCYDKNGQKIVYWDQGDPRWGQVQLPGGNDGNIQANTYSVSACGQTVLAMILASYTDPGITPMDVTQQYYPWSNYKGTGFPVASDVLTKKGYDVERLNVSTQKLKEYIKNGWLGFTSITFKDRNDNIHSHFTLIVDVNSKGDFVYNDPYFGENTTLKDKGVNYTIDDITLIKPPKK